MGNSRIFHDFRPLGVCANQDPDPPPRVGQGPANGRHTEGPFSCGGDAGPGRWGCGAGRRPGGSTKEAKRPLLLRKAAASGEEGAGRAQAGGRQAILRAQPHLRNRVYTNSQKQAGETEAWRGWWAQSHARTEASSRQIAHGVWESACRKAEPWEGS